MRFFLLALALVVARPAHAEEPPRPESRPAVWYAGWSLIAAGGAATLTGAALTTQGNTDGNGVPQPGLSSAGTAGWVMVSLGTAVWIGGVLALKLTTGSAARGSRK
jgi:hypothetical protein